MYINNLCAYFIINSNDIMHLYCFDVLVTSLHSSVALKAKDIWEGLQEMSYLKIFGSYSKKKIIDKLHFLLF